MVFCVNRTSKVIFIYGAGGHTGEAAPQWEIVVEVVGLVDYL